MKSKAKEENLDLKVIRCDFFDMLDKFKNNFEYIVEYTFYCAIDPINRNKYVNIVHHLLNDNGSLIALFYLIKIYQMEGHHLLLKNQR